MTLELECPRCQVRLAVETGGVTVQCPGCDALLEVPAFNGVATNGPTPSPTAENPQAATTLFTPPGEDADQTAPGAGPHDWEPSTVADRGHVAPGQVDRGQIDGGQDDGGQLEFPFEPKRARATPADDETTEFVPLGDEKGGQARPNSGSVDADLSTIHPTHPSQADTEVLPAFPNLETSVPTRPVGSTKLETNGKPSSDSHGETIATAMSRNVSSNGESPVVKLSTPQLLLVSYACAVTLACLYLLYLIGIGGTASQLESLPDLAPPVDKKGNPITLQIVPGNAPMPPGHTLALGQSQRFGDIILTPLRVTRGPLKFKHYTGKSEFKRDPTAPVLALHVAWKNVSRSQAFTPLDAALLYSRRGGEGNARPGSVPANNIVFLQKNKSGTLNPLPMYDLAIDGEWDFAGQNLGKSLKPGETTEMFIPTSEETPFELDGDLLWRLHFRKGHNPQSGRGVTTIVEVAFHSDDISEE